MTRRNTMRRRTLLRAACGSLALPFFPSWAWAQRAGSESSGPPKRFVAIYCPNGVIKAEWLFAKDSNGAIRDTGTTLAALAPRASDLIQVTNCKWGGFYEGTQRLGLPGALGHHGEHAGYLTGSIPKTDAFQQLEANDASIDQKIASMSNHVPLTTGFMDSPGNYPPCHRSLSWKSGTDAVLYLKGPQPVFDHLFGVKVDTTRFKAKVSVLHGVASELSSFRNKLGQGDKHHLDHYLTRLEEVEGSVLKLSESCVEPTGDYQTADRLQWTDLMVDLALLALECDATRAVTMTPWSAGGGDGGSIGRYLEGLSRGIGGNFHTFSHYKEGQGTLRDWQLLTGWCARMFERFVNGLHSRMDSDGTTMLHNSLVMFGSTQTAAHGYSDAHNVFAGQCGGAARTGRVIHGQGQYMENLLPEILSLFDYKTAEGVEQTKVGISNGQLSLR